MAEQLDLAYAIGLEPEKAVDYFKSKGYEFSFDWYDMWQESHAKSFTVAKAMQADVLEDIRGMVDKAITDGITLHDFQKELTPALQRRGWWGREIVDNPKGGIAEVQLGSPTRLETIYRTNTQTAYNVGRYRDQVENVADRPYWQYVAVMDTLTRPTHAALNGKVFKASDPFWNSHYPPNGFNCRCRVRALTKDQLQAKGLEVLTGEGHLSEKKVEVARGVEKPVTVFKGYGINMAPDPGWSYNPGKVDWEPELPKYEPDIRKELQKAEAGRGLAKEYPVKSFEDIGKMMKAWDEQNPGIFHRGYKEVIPAPPKATYFMATDTSGTILLKDKNLAAYDNWNPSKDLQKALKKIGQGKDLSFNEEYSIESLWHEVLHNRARGSMRLPDQSTKRILMETLNQFVARHTYPDFLASLGGLEAHGEQILKEGYGYGQWVQNFRTILEASGISEPDALEALKEVSFYTPWDKIPEAIAEALAELYGDARWKPQFLRTLNLVNVFNAEDLDQRVRDILLGR